MTQLDPDAPALEGWQRLSPWAMGLLLISGGASLLRQHLPLVAGAGAGLAMVERIGLREMALGGVLLLGAALLLSLAYYRRFRFRLDGDLLIICRGLLERREFKVAAEHVQQVEIHQPFYMRPFGLVQWQVETRAGEASRIALPGIRRDVAEALDRRLRPAGGVAKAASEPDEAAAEPARPAPRLRYRITPGALVLHGLASRSVYVIAAMLSPLVRPLERWLHETLPQTTPPAWLPTSAPAAVALGMAALLLGLALLSVLAAWWRFHGYRLHDDDGERQRQVSGLFNRREQVLMLSRLQVVEWVQTGLGRLLRRGYLVCHQFGAAGGAEAEARRFVVPGLGLADGRRLAGVFWPGLAMATPLARVEPLYRGVLFLRMLLALLAAALVGAWLLIGAVLNGESAGDAASGGLALRSLAPGAGPGVLSAVFLVGLGGLTALAALLAQLRWCALGWAREGEYLIVRQGLLGQRTRLFPTGSLVAVEVQQSWLQRRRGVATLHLHLANGPVTLPYLRAERANALANRLLAGVEAEGSAPAPSLR
jgi:putative membrane protein